MRHSFRLKSGDIPKREVPPKQVSTRRVRQSARGAQNLLPQSPFDSNQLLRQIEEDYSRWKASKEQDSSVFIENQECDGT